jgi:lipase ATG15
MGLCPRSVTQLEMRLPQAIAWALSLWPSPPIEPAPPTKLDTLNLTLRHVHAHKGGRVVFKDVSDQQRFFIQQQPAEGDGRQIETSYQITPRLMKTYKPRSQAQFFEAREASLKKLRQRRCGFPLASNPNKKDEEDIVVVWDEWDVPGPDTESRETLTVLAKMTWNAYMTPDDGSWYDLGADWGQVCIFCVSLTHVGTSSKLV